jgi:alanyl-tRNA synthetase
MIKAEEIRRKYLDYFTARQHHLAKSDGLVPSSDPTLLFTSAGMVQFKNMFLGRTKLEYKRAVSCQKCFRTNDIERVGRTARHHTFFEMLGNFSFGDYFKKEAIAWAWEFLTKEVGLPAEKLWVTIYEDDDEAAKIWAAIVKPERIVRLGKDSNFWEMGPTGPCGPCSEIIFDQGEKFGCGKEECRVGCDCDRYLEVWNLVFTQFDRDESGHLNPLPQKNIDTGMGLERLAAVVQGVPSNFDTDLFRPLIQQTADLAGVEYSREEKTDVYLKIISDHIRGITFLVSEGILPSNEGRGYVLRRLIRRAHRYGKLLNINEPFLHRLAGSVIESMKSVYPELTEAREHIYSVIMQEEKKFQQTLEQGLNVFKTLAETLKSSQAAITGTQGFELYDTYGFPPDLTKEIAAEEGLPVSKNFEGEFNLKMEKQKEMARAAWKGSGAEDNTYYSVVHKEFGDTDFTGYTDNAAQTNIRAIFVDKKAVSSASAGAAVSIILASTPFYGETGGQVGDTGKLVKSGGEIEITGTLKPFAD